MTELNKWVLIEAGHDEDEYDIDVNILAVFDNEEDAKERLKSQVEAERQELCGDYEDEDFEDDNISWNDDETKATITDDECCVGWCKVYEVKKI